MASAHTIGEEYRLPNLTLSFNRTPIGRRRHDTEIARHAAPTQSDCGRNSGIPEGRKYSEVRMGGKASGVLSMKGVATRAAN